MIKTPEALTKDEQDRYQASLPIYFNPDAPVRTPELFAGRLDQINEVLKVLYHPGGRHVIVYGERGVGKTSLVTVLPQLVKLAQREIQDWYIGCTHEDTFVTLWKNVFSEVYLTITEGDQQTSKSIADILGDKEITPHLIQQQLAELSQATTLVFVFDEFDAIADLRTKRQFAETIKLLSDRGTKAVIILVGIGDNVNDLIMAHESIERNVSQIMMPRMDQVEAKLILTTNGLDKLSGTGMGIDDRAVEKIIKISQGFPNYIHALGLNAALSAVYNLRRNVDLSDVEVAIKKPIGQMHQSLVTAYHKAIHSSKKKTLIREVLLACALAKTDSAGYFYPADVREPFRLVTKNQDYDIPNFLPTMKGLTEDRRGPALKKIGSSYEIQYRFNKVLLQPFVIMQGLIDRLITDEQLSHLSESRPNDS